MQVCTDPTLLDVAGAMQALPAPSLGGQVTVHWEYRTSDIDIGGVTCESHAAPKKACEGQRLRIGPVETCGRFRWEVA